MARTEGPVTYNAEDGLTLETWRERWPDVPVHRTADGIVHVRALAVGSPERGALWHLHDYHVIAVSVTGVHLQAKAII